MLSDSRELLQKRQIFHSRNAQVLENCVPILINVWSVLCCLWKI
jgi:hypothetical protein